MIRFVEGPANGVRLSLSRMVFFLRVVRAADGTWDALDKLEDTMAPGETAFVYRHNKTEGTAFVDGTDAQGRRRGWVENIASYVYHGVQPTDAEMRDNAAWSKWCQAQPEAAKFKKSGPSVEE